MITIDFILGIVLGVIIGFFGTAFTICYLVKNMRKNG